MKIVNGEGILNPKIAIVGEAPGEIEEALGRPFMGPSGKLLNSVLDEFGIDRDECYITNVVKFRPEGNRTPTEDEIDKWRPLLQQELLIVNPKFVICLGATAMKAISGANHAKITEHRGKLYNTIWGMDYLSTWHPSYVLRNRSEYDTLKKDFELALTLASK